MPSLHNPGLSMLKFYVVLCRGHSWILNLEYNHFKPCLYTANPFNPKISKIVRLSHWEHLSLPVAGSDVFDKIRTYPHILPFFFAIHQR